MLKLIIEDDEGRKTVVPFVREEITIGRQEGNTIRLTERNVSRRHARLVRQDGHVLVEDLGSYNGIHVNGERIKLPVPVQDGDLIQIGDYDLAIQADPNARDAPSEPPRAEASPLLAAHQRLTEPPAAEPWAPADPSGEHPAHPTPLDALEVSTSATTAELPALTFPPTAPPPPPPAAHRATSIIRADKLEGMKPPRVVEELDSDHAPRLVVLNTPVAGQEFACIRTELRIGRTDDADNDISIDHRSLSRTHAKLVRENTGEWRIIDLQSANGLSVNGYPYAESTLAFGDVFELGHVKFKFLGPTDVYTFRPGDGETARRPKVKSRKGLVGVLSFVTLAALIATGVGFAKREGRLPPVPEKLAALFGMAPVTAPVVRKKEAPEPTPDPGTESARGTPALSGTPPEVQLASDAEKLDAARKAIEAKNFDRSLEVLSSVQSADPKVVRQRASLEKTAEAEASVKKSMHSAQQKLAQGNLAEAEKQLSGLTSELQASELAELREQAHGGARVAVASAEVPVASAASTESSMVMSTDSNSQAKGLLDEGTQLFRRGRAEHEPEAHEKLIRKSLGKFEDCVKVLPAEPGCHMMEGSAHAELQELDRAAVAYREFIKLSANNPAYAKFRGQVRKYLDGYQAQKKGKSDTP